MYQVMMFAAALLSSDCNRAGPDPVTTVPMPGTPFQALPSRDGCWIFVSLPGTPPDSTSKIVVLRRSNGQVTVFRTVPVQGAATGMAVTHDQALLVVTAGRDVVFLDVKRLTGDGDPVVAYWHDDVEAPGRVYLNLTSDDRYLFISDESVKAITVLDLARARRSNFAGADLVIGKIPVGVAPIALTFSKNRRYLFTTSQSMTDSGWPNICRPERPTDPPTPPNHPEGAVIVVDVAKAKTDPARSIVATVPTGCHPVRLVTSPDGKLAYVTVRGDDALRVFDTKKLVEDPTHAELARLPVGRSPVGIAVIDRGRKVVLTNSNRFGANQSEPSSLMVVDAAQVSRGAAAVIGRIPAGAFPREIRITTDQRTMIFTNFGSRSVVLVDLARLPLLR